MSLRLAWRVGVIGFSLITVMIMVMVMIMVRVMIMIMGLV